MQLIVLGLVSIIFPSSGLGLETQVFSHINHHIAFDSETLPPQILVRHSVALPHSAHIKPDTSSWYQLTFRLMEKPQDSLGLFMPLINMNASVYVNGQLIGVSGSFEEPMSRFWHTPVFFYLPATNLNQGENHIHIRLKASKPNDLTQLGKVYIGEVKNIYRIYAEEFFASYTIHLMSISAAIFLGFITLYLWSIRRLDEYLYFSLASITWAISSLNIVVHNPPVSSFAWEWLVHSTLSWMSFFVLLFIRRVINQGHNNLEKALWVVHTLFTIGLLITPNPYFFSVANLWHFIAILIGIYAVFLVIRSYIRHPKRTTLILGLGFLMIALFAIHDYFVVIQVLDAENRFLLDYSMPLLLLSIAIVLIHRFVEASQGLEKANATLEQRVQEAEREIKEGYKIISAMESAKAVDKERTRIFGDLHDDLGAKLLSLVYKSETDEQKKLAKQAMEGLREIVKRSPVVAPETLNPLHDWLAECQKRCTEHSIPFEWHQHRVPKHFTPPIELTNILREAISNAIKHGDGKRICVRIQIRFGLFIMSVCNTGKAINKGTTQGSGKSNMHRRIKALGGKIRWRSGKKGGCHVLWTLPLEV